MVGLNKVWHVPRLLHEYIQLVTSKEFGKPFLFHCKLTRVGGWVITNGSTMIPYRRSNA